MARSLDEMQALREGESTGVLLEMTAGQGSAVGYRFEQVADILEHCRHGRLVGVCLDTCHLFAAGYDFREPESYGRLMEEIDRIIELSLVRCIHLNDSKREFGSRVDRHEHIGQGKIGEKGFANFVNDAGWRDVPMVLETPKGKDGRGADFDKMNLKGLRALIR